MFACEVVCDEGIGGGALLGNGDDPELFEVDNLGGKLGGLLGLVIDGELLGTVVMVEVPVVGAAVERGEGLVVLEAEF